MSDRSQMKNDLYLFHLRPQLHQCEHFKEKDLLSYKCNYFLDACYATLQPAMMVRWLVGPLFTFSAFLTLEFESDH